MGDLKSGKFTSFLSVYPTVSGDPQHCGDIVKRLAFMVFCEERIKAKLQYKMCKNPSKVLRIFFYCLNCRLGGLAQSLERATPGQ